MALEHLTKESFKEKVFDFELNKVLVQFLILI